MSEQESQGAGVAEGEEEILGEEQEVEPQGDDEEPEEEGAEPIHRQPVGGGGLAPREPSEVMRGFQPDLHDEATQAAVLEQAGGRLDHSLDHARRDIAQERELASKAVVYREWPEELQGTKISGRIRMFRAPFKLIDIEDWVQRVLGGGKYRIRLLDGKGKYVDQKVLEVAGDPKMPNEEEEKAAAQSQAAASADEERRLLERELQEERTERRMEQMQARNDMMFDRLATSMEKMSEAIAAKNSEPAKPPLDVTAAIAAAAPIVTGILASMDAKAAAAAKQASDDRKFMLQQQQAAEARTAELMKTMQPKKESLTDVLAGVEKLKKLTGGSDDPAKVFQTLMKESVPILMSTMSKIQLHKAGVTEGDDEEFGMKYVADRVTDLAQAFITRPGGAPQQPQQPVTHAPAQQYGAQVQAPQQAQAIPHDPNAVQHPQATTSGAPAPPGPTGDPSQVTHAQPPQGAAPDINTEIFEKALLYMSQGKPGSHLAHDLMQEEEEIQKANPNSPHKYLAPRIVSYICNVEPETVLAILNPHIQQREQFHALLDPIGQEFLRDFCLYFSQPDDNDDGDEDEEPDVEAPQAPAAPEAPQTGSADDITGGLKPEEGSSDE